MSVLVNHHFGERFESFPSRDNLRQNIDAIAVVANHLFDRLQLADDFPQSNLQGAFLLSTVNVLGGRSHC